jgi:hypothetical protein
MAIIAFLMMQQSAHSQSKLSPADSSHSALLKQELTLSPIQVQQMDSILRSTAEKIITIDKELIQISRSNQSQDEKDKKQADLREQKRNAKESRDLSILLLLTSEQRAIYDTKIKPSKPGVLHMGMNHDRAQCEICIVK